MIKYFLRLTIAIFMFASFGLSTSCTKEKVPNVPFDCTDTISFASQIAPLISNNCISCHDTGNSTGYIFTNHSNISNNAIDILNALRGEGGKQLMPQGGPALNDTLIQQFSCWVNQGTLNN